MKQIRTSIFLALALFAMTVFAAKVGDQAPDFTGTDSHGQTHKLSDYKGKFVVLEWHNNGCPFTKKHYESGNMQRLQKEWTDKGVIWFTVISSAPGAQGYVTPEQENEYLQKMHAVPTAALLDPKGEIGHLYSAKTTPHMFIINPQGQLIYNGAIDDKSTSDPGDINGAKNYVSEALQEARAGQPVAVASTRPYGCSVKYAD
ncbi:MAG: thioredoxin family protein [Acidobacteria bacterium]|nr:MAG: thioredoxin family protein [Acidobacteriota bacterium]PYY22802.1 MAG: thioredoxin family protein [Acidobacteriota bacterium]